jgi:hypothetical protein
MAGGSSVPASRAGPAAFLAVDVAVATAIVAAVVAATGLGKGCLAIEGSWAPDVRAAGALASPDVRGRLVLPFVWGEYAIWHFGPRLRVSIDGRRETVYSDRMLIVDQAVESGNPDGFDFLGHERPEYVWLPTSTGSPTRTWLETHDYRMDIDTGTSFIATRADLPILGPGRELPRCFP